MGFYIRKCSCTCILWLNIGNQVSTEITKVMKANKNLQRLLLHVYSYFTKRLDVMNKFDRQNLATVVNNLK